MEDRAILPRIPSVHPGEILKEDFLEPLNLSAYRLAKDIDVPLTRITAILDRKRAVTADTALRLARYFGTSVELWLNLQSSYELQEARAGLADEVEKIKPLERELAAV